MPQEPSTVPPEAIEVLRAFMEAADRKDEEKMKACLSRRTVESGEFRSSGPEGVQFVLGEARMEGPIVVVPVKGMPTDGSGDGAPAMEMDCLIIQEDGQWKFDLSGTVERMMGGDLGKALEQMTQAMAQAMEGIGQAMAEGFNAAFNPPSPDSESADKSSEPADEPSESPDRSSESPDGSSESPGSSQYPASAAEPDQTTRRRHRKSRNRPE